MTYTHTFTNKDLWHNSAYIQGPPFIPLIVNKSYDFCIWGCREG